MTRWLIALAVGVAAAATSLTGGTPTGAAARPPARQNAPLLMMSPKAQAAGWTGVHKPHTRIADVLARHTGQTDWAETVVDDESLNAQWISLNPGKKTPRRMNGNTREWWIVQSGTLRFTIEGIEPIVATKGVMVQVPYRTLYQIENPGAEPALPFEVNVARAQALSGGRDAGAASRHWLFGVPALALGLTADAIPIVGAGAWCLFAATLLDSVNVARILRHAFQTPKGPRPI